MKILVTGSTGLIGTAIVEALRSQGNQVLRLVRPKTKRKTLPPPGHAEVLEWDPIAKRLDVSQLEGLDAVIHLAGESLVGLWTEKKRARIRESRLAGTSLLSAALATVKNPPKVFLSASAVGFYGHRGETILTEDTVVGTGYLAEVCQAWERATQAAQRRGIRVAHLRFGMVLSATGGALYKMLPAFRLGLGGHLGTGRQQMSWITLEDIVGAVVHILKTESLAGPVNMVTPNPVTNQHFTRALGKALNRPTPFPIPEPLLRALLGQLAQELFLSSTRAFPNRLQESGYHFRFGYLEDALAAMFPKKVARARS